MARSRPFCFERENILYNFVILYNTDMWGILSIGH